MFISSIFSLPLLLIVCLGSLLVMMLVQQKGVYTPITRQLMKGLFYSTCVSAVLILVIVASRFVSY